MNLICDICTCVVNVAVGVTSGYVGDALEWHLKAQLASVGLIKLYPYILYDASPEDLTELGLAPAPTEK